MKILHGALVTAVLLAGQAVAQQQQYAFQNPDLPVEERITNLLSLLTMQEKIDFLGTSLNLKRLGIHTQGDVPTIPGSGGQFEGLHGLAVGGPGNWGRRSPGGSGEYGGTSDIPTTQFPQTVGMGETWDPDLIRLEAAEEGKEARYIFQSYDRGGLIIRAPNADLMRDPRWGRAEESYGEDPFLTGTMATAFVKGLQGDDPKHWLSISLVKHFLANSNEDDRLGSSSNFDAALLHDYYAFPFRMAIEQGGANALMVSYNAMNAVPMTANPLVRTLVMKQWGFNGMVDSDRGALTNMVTHHKYYPDLEHAAAGAIHAGVNQFLNSYVKPVQDALNQKLINEADIDENLRGVFRVLISVGLLDPPSRSPYSSIHVGAEPTPWGSTEAKDLVLRITRESIVLLKNAPVAGGHVLPLDRSKLHSIAVIGPSAQRVFGDSYGGTPPFTVSPLKGIENLVGKSVAVRSSDNHDQAVSLARSSDVAIVLVGNDPTCGERPGHCSNPREGKEAVDRKELGLDPDQEKLIEDVVAVNKRTIVVLISSFPYTINWAQEHVPAIVHMAHCSEVEGDALAQVLFGDYDPAGRLVVTWPASLSQLPPMMDYDLRHGRTYMYLKDKPLYPFGYGLSYTRFKYSDMQTSANHVSLGGKVVVSVRITNAGNRAGDEVVQMYVKPMNPALSHGEPPERLAAYRRISLQSGERKTVSFELPAERFEHWDQAQNDWTLDFGSLQIAIGGSSADLRVSKVITLAR